jgi:SAM-dependent methyltransferase
MSANPIHYTHCPVCSSTQIHPALTARDYTVSQQEFPVWHCDHCTARFTQDIPGLEDIGPYYQSDAYVSHSDTKEGLINRLYHLIRKRTLQSKRIWVESAVNKRQGDLLDVGAGTGAFAYTMQTAGWQVKGLEPDSGARTQAQNLYQLQLASPDELYHLASAQFDAISLWHVLEHVHDLQGYMQNFHRLLKPDGKLLIAVPNYTSLDAQIYGACWAAYDVPRHLYHFSPRSMEQLADIHGFRIERKRPMWFDSVYVSMLSEKYKNGKGNIVAALWNGMRSNLKAISAPQHCSSVVYELSKKP